MSEPLYVTVAGDFAKRIRAGKFPPGTQLPSFAEIAQQHEVSDIVVRKAIKLLQSQGLVHTIQRRGIFVTNRPNLVRVSPERQMETPEVTFKNESDGDVQVTRESQQVPASEELAKAFGIADGDSITHTVTRVAEAGRSASVSDSYQPLGVNGTSSASYLEEKVADRIPEPAHAEWLNTSSGELVKTVHQQFFTADGTLIMVSDVSYPRDRYEGFVFRMALDRD